MSGDCYQQFKKTLSNKWERLFLSSVLLYLWLFFFFIFRPDKLQVSKTALYCIFLFFILFDPDEKKPTRRRTIRGEGGGHITQTHTHVTRQRKSPKMLHRDRAGCQRHSMRGWRWRSKNCKRESKGNDRPRRQIMIIIIQEKKARVIGRRGWLTNHLERILLPSICRDGNAQGQPKMAKETNPLQ